MSRLKRFFRNAGALGIVQVLVLAFVLFFCLRRDYLAGTLFFTLTAMVGGFCVPYGFRHVLIRHAKVIARLMNVVALVGIVYALFLRVEPSDESIVLRTGLAAIMSLYMGCYFWLLSDERVAVKR